MHSATLKTCMQPLPKLGCINEEEVVVLCVVFVYQVFVCVCLCVCVPHGSHPFLCVCATWVTPVSVCVCVCIPDFHKCVRVVIGMT